MAHFDANFPFTPMKMCHFFEIKPSLLKFNVRNSGQRNARRTYALVQGALTTAVASASITTVWLLHSSPPWNSSSVTTSHWLWNLLKRLVSKTCLIFLGFFCSTCIYVNTLLCTFTSCAITLFTLCPMVKTHHLNRPLLECLTTLDQSARSGTLTLSDQNSAGHSDPLQVPSLLAWLNEPPWAPTRSRTDGAGSRPLLESLRTAGPYMPVPSLLAHFSAPPQAPARLENNEADSRLLSKDFGQALHRGLMLSLRSSRNSSPAHGYRAKRKTPPSGFTTPQWAKRTRTLAERLTTLQWPLLITSRVILIQHF